MKGLCGVKDMREVHQLAVNGDKRAGLAIDMFCFRVCKYIGAYYVTLEGLDALIFTGGIGENDPIVRQIICSKLSILGIRLDNKRNLNYTGEAFSIHAPNSKKKVLVVPTNAELEIAPQTLSIINQSGGSC